MDTHVLANAVVVVHAAFVLFVITGGFWVRLAPRVALLHLPALAWAVFVEFSGTLCPLTPMEVTLRQRAGEVGFSGGFIDHYLLPLLYPAGLTRETQLVLGVIALAINAVAYGWALRDRQMLRRRIRME